MTTPQIGEMVYLKSVMANVHIYGVVSDGETPDQFTATLEIAGDNATMTLAALVGPPGRPGQNAFALRLQTSTIDDPEDLPYNLTDQEEDIGKYWVMNQYDSTDAEQLVTITGNPGGGSFTLTYDGQTTIPIAYNATAAQVESALEALPSIGNGNVSVDGQAGGPYTITFTGQLGAQDVGAVTANGSALSNPSPTILVATPTAGVAAVNAVQTVTISGGPTGGTFTLTLNGQTTAALPYNATAAALQTALQSLPSIGAGNATVTGDDGGPYTVTFVGGMGGQVVAQMTADDSGLTGGTAPAVAVATTTAGVSGVNEKQTLTLKGAGGGTFTITYAGQTTDPIPYNASAVVVEDALASLSNIAPGDVSVSGIPGGPYTVEFTGTLAATDVGQLTADDSGLTGTALAVTVTNVTIGGTVLTGSRAYIWFGDHYKVLMMGSEGPPGPVPNIAWSVELLDPDGDVDSYMQQTGTPYNPSVRVYLRVPKGPKGDSTNIAEAPDVDLSSPPDIGQVLGFAGRYLADGTPIWEPLSIGDIVPRPYIMPEAAFVSFQGLSTRAPIGSFAIPAQTFPWKPLVWGKIKATGVSLDPDPLTIGMEVRLGDPTTGQLVGRGFGNTTGWTICTPHTSTPSDPASAMTPDNPTAKVPANHSGNQGTLYVNLYNDGSVGAYIFNPANAQLFVQVNPV